VNKVTRRRVLQLHRWAGLLIGPALAYLALTGSTLLLRPHLERAVYENLHGVSACRNPLSLDRLISNASVIHPGGSVRQIEMSNGVSDATLIRYNDLQGLYVDPCTGKVLGQQHRWGGVFGTLESLHRLRYFIDNGDVTEPISGTLSIAIAAIVALGLTLWRPRSREQLKRSLSLRSRLTGPAFEMHLHRALGAYAAIVLLVSAFGAWTMTFSWARTAINAATLSAPPAGKPRSTASASERASPGALLATTQRVVPNWTRMTLIPARRPGDTAEVQILERDAPHPNARTTLYLDAGNAEVIRLDAYATSSTGYKVYRWLVSLHMGYVGGVAGQIIQGGAMLMVPVLFYTGLRSYLTRRRARAEGAGSRVSRVSKLAR
jgi:vanillate O-demethylase ferredoxin subunit